MNDSDNVSSNRTVFIVEDEADISRLIQFHLETAGYLTKAFADGSRVLRAAEEVVPALFLLDIMLPQGDGRDLCKQIRAHPQLRHSRVIFVSAKTSEADRVLGFELGADDYVSKPFSPRELVARVKAVLRAGHASQGPSLLRFGEVVLNVDAMTLQVRSKEIPITATEFRILEVLMSSPRHVFARHHLLDLIWGTERNVDLRSVDVYISRLRDKLESDTTPPRYLKTIRGLGYYFDPQQRGRRSGRELHEGDSPRLAPPR